LEEVYEMPGTNSSALGWSPKADIPGNCIETKVLEGQTIS
jgi:hypothetical protein